MGLGEDVGSVNGREVENDGSAISEGATPIMTAPVVVKPYCGDPKLLAASWVVGFGMTFGLLVMAQVESMSFMCYVSTGTAFVLSGALVVFMAVTQRPCVIITSEGFTFRSAVGSQSEKWEHIDGDFAVFTFGLWWAVAYKLTPRRRVKLFGRHADVDRGGQGASRRRLRESRRHHAMPEARVHRLGRQRRK